MQANGTEVRSMTAGIFPGNIVRADQDDVFTIDTYTLEKWEMSSDAKTFSLELRNDIFWHDGVQFTADDVKFWFDLEFNPPEGRRPSIHSQFLGPVTNVEVIDLINLTVTLSEPRTGWLAGLVYPFAAIAHPKHLFEPEIQAGNPDVSPDQVGWVGFGPFKYVSYRKGSDFVMERNPSYFLKDEFGQQLPYLDSITYVVITDPTTMVASFKTGRIAATSRGSGFHLTLEQIDSIKADLGDQAVFDGALHFPYAVMTNSKMEPWDDVNLRQAVSLYLDRQSACQAVYSGQCEIAAMWDPGSQYVNPDVLEWPGYRPDKTADRAVAKQLIVDGGYEGLKVEFISWDAWSRQGEFTVNELNSLGLDASLKLVDAGTFFGGLATGEFALYVTGTLGLHPEDMLPQFGLPASWVQFDDPRFEEMRSNILGKATSNADRYRLAQEIERYVIQEQAYMTVLFWEPGIIAIRSFVKGYPFPAQNMSNNNNLETVWISHN
jgi:peptide/nickel transport system substrate-binding protein